MVQSSKKKCFLSVIGGRFALLRRFQSGHAGEVGGSLFTKSGRVGVGRGRAARQRERLRPRPFAGQRRVLLEQFNGVVPLANSGLRKGERAGLGGQLVVLRLADPAAGQERRKILLAALAAELDQERSGR